LVNGQIGSYLTIDQFPILIRVFVLSYSFASRSVLSPWLS
jgi:hypothetical protein